MIPLRNDTAWHPYLRYNAAAGVITAGRGKTMLGIDKVVKFLISEKLQVVVEAPPEVVFSYLEDISRQDGWMLDGSVEKTSEGPVGAGSTFITSTRPGVAPWGTKTMLEVTEFLPNQRLVYETDADGLRIRQSFDLQPADG